MQTPIQQRNQAFVRQAMAILATHMQTGERITRRQLINKALACRPPAYFTHHDKISSVLTVLARHHCPEPKTERQAMWMEIKQRVDDLMTGPRKLNRPQAISFVLNFTRPSRYFISYVTAERLLYKLIRTTSYAVPC